MEELFSKYREESEELHPITEDLNGSNNNSKRTSNSKTIIAYTVAFLCVIGNCTSVICAQLLGHAVPMFELSTFRFLAQIIISWLFAFYTNTSLRVYKHQWFYLTITMFFYGAYSVMFFTAATFITLGVLTGLENTAVILFMVIWSLIKRRKDQHHIYAAAVVSVVGIIMLTQPHWLVGEFANRAMDVTWKAPCSSEQAPRPVSAMNISQLGIPLPIIGNYSGNSSVIDKSTADTKASSRKWIGYVLALITGLCGAGCYQSITKFLEKEKPWMINFWIAVTGFTILFVLTLIFEIPKLALPLSLPCLGYFIVVVILEYQLSTPYCLQYMSPSVYALIRALELPLLVTTQHIFNNIVRPPLVNWLAIVGSVICCVGVLLGPIVQLWLDIKGMNQLSKDDEEEMAEFDENLNEAKKPLLQVRRDTPIAESDIDS